MNKNEEIDKLKNALMDKVKSENDFRYVDLLPDEIMKIVIDSSNKGKYVFWVLREYLKDNIQRFEDMGRVKQALILFKNNLSKFTEQEKQLNRLSFQELESLVEPYQDVLTQNEIKRMNKEKIYSETRILYDGPEGKVLVPLTKESAIFWGQGTKWCTGSTNSQNYFEYYNKQGFLYIVITKNEKKEIKHQLHFQTNQFMNSEDEPIDEIPDLFYNKFEQFGVFDKFSIIFAESLFSKTFFTDNLNLPPELKITFLKNRLKKMSIFSVTLLLF